MKFEIKDLPYRQQIRSNVWLKLPTIYLWAAGTFIMGNSVTAVVNVDGN